MKHLYQTKAECKQELTRRSQKINSKDRLETLQNQLADVCGKDASFLAYMSYMESSEDEDNAEHMD